MEIQTDNPKEGYPFPCFSYDENNSVVLNTAYIMTSDSIDIRYVLGILNSSVGRMIARLYVTQLQERQFRMLAQYLTNFPVPKANSDVVKSVSECVKHQIISPSEKNESTINSISFQQFGFSEDEIEYIEKL